MPYVLQGSNGTRNNSYGITMNGYQAREVNKIRDGFRFPVMGNLTSVKAEVGMSSSTYW